MNTNEEMNLELTERSLAGPGRLSLGRRAERGKGGGRHDERDERGERLFQSFPRRALIWA